METTHIAQAFDRDIERIKALLLEMGGLVEAQLIDAVKSLVSRNAKLSNKVQKSDRKINELLQTIDEKAIRLLALRQPMADDLRTVIAIIKVASSLERIGDYAKNIAKRSSVLVQLEPVGSSANTLKRMNKLVHVMIIDVMDAFVNRDISSANDIRLRDEEVDLMHNTLFRELLTYMMEDPHHISSCMHLLFVAKNIERAGDHAVQIAEQVHYLVSGNMPEDRRPKSDKTSTIIVESDDSESED